MKKKNTLLSILMAMMLVITSIFPGVRSAVFAEDGGNRIDMNFSNIDLKIDGEAIQPGVGITIGNGTVVSLSGNWSIDDTVNLNSGDYGSLDLPDIFQAQGSGMGDIILIDSNDMSHVVGTFTIGDQLIKFDFNEVMSETLTMDREGEFLMNFSFKENSFIDNVIQDVNFGVDDSDFQIRSAFDVEVKEISKTGVLNTTINPTHINWEIDVNTKLENLMDSKLTDTTPEGLFLEEDSFEIYELTVGSDGKKKQGTEKINLPVSFSNGGFSIELPEDGKAYRILYKTRIDAYPENGYKNTAVLKEGDTVKARAEYSISKIVKENLLTKEAWHNTTQDATSITWRLYVNKAQQTLSNVSIEDQLPAGTSLDRIEVYKVKPNGSNWQRESDDLGFSTLPIELGDLAGQAYEIIIVTKIDDRDTYLKTEEYLNEAIMKSGDTELETATGSFTNTRSPILDKTGTDLTDYEGVKIGWTVTLNEANHTINNAVMKDTIVGGHELIPGSVKVLDANGAEVTIAEANLKLESNLLEIKLGDINSKYTVTYQTKVTDPELTNFKNDVGLSGDGLNGDGIIGGNISKESETSQTRENFYQKSAHGINYATQEMAWELVVDPIKDEIVKLEIRDNFSPDKSMYFLKETFEVFRGSERLLEAEYTLHDLGVNGFEVEIHGPLARAKYTIKYKTSFNPDIVENNGGVVNSTREYKNTAHFDVTTKNINNVEKTETIEREATQPQLREDIYNAGYKSGEIDHNSRIITWNVFVNAMGRDLSGIRFTVIDTLSDGQILNETITLYPYTLNTHGQAVVDTTSPLDDLVYVLEKTATGFDITFPDGIDQPINIQLGSTIEGVSKENYTNHAQINGKHTNINYGSTVAYDDWKNFVEKKALNDYSGSVFTDDEVEWHVTLNKSHSVINNAVFEDTMSSSHVLLKDTIEVNGVPVSADKVTMDTDENGVTIFTVALGNISEEVILTYTTVVVSTHGIITNQGKLSGNETIEQKVVVKTYEAKKSSSATGSGRENRGSITIMKVDGSDTEEDVTKKNLITSNPTKFELSYLLNGEKRIVNSEPMLTENGRLVYPNLPFRTYTLKEIEAPIGFELTDQEFEFVITSQTGQKDVEIYIENPKIKTEFSVEKEWVNGETLSREAVEVDLFRNGVLLEDQTVSLSVDNNWRHTWTDLDKTDINGVNYEYTVKEKKVENYDASYSYDKTSNSAVITNTYKIPLTQFTVEKTWTHGNENMRPDVTVHLYQNDRLMEEKSQTLSAQNDWTYTWVDLEKTDSKGKTHEYMVLEAAIDNYTPTYVYESESVEIINTYSSPLRTFTVFKEWVHGKEDARPEISVQLLRNGSIEGAVVALNKDNDWSYEWTGLLQTDLNGIDYEYTVVEFSVENFTPSYEYEQESVTITNTYESPKIDLTATKEWVDGPLPKPAIELQLYRNGIALGDVVALNGDVNSDWTVTWTDLLKTDLDGEDYVYTVRETDVDNYIAEYDDTLHLIKNHYDSPLIDKTVTKLWHKGSDIKPAIEVQLLQNGSPIGDAVLLDGNEENPWTFTWSDLKENDENGKAYIYSVLEVENHENYVPFYALDDLGNFIITNAYLSPTTDIKVEKIWIGGPIDRPDIEIQLMRDGEPYLEAITLKSNETEYVWHDMDLTDEYGFVYEYTFKEVNVPENYVVSYVEGTIINTYISPLTDITVEKVWVNAPTIKPTITVQLFRNGVAFMDAVDMENGTTQHTWRDLDLTDQNGTPYVYSVDEINVPNIFKKSVDGFVITNTLITEKLPLTGAADINMIAFALIGFGGLLHLLGRRRKKEVN